MAHCGVHFLNINRQLCEAVLYQLNLTIFAACLLFAIAMNVPLAAAHELEDGFVERAIGVQVRDRTVLIEYWIGMNPLTMSRYLDSADRRSPQPESGPGSSEQPSIEKKFSEEETRLIEDQLIKSLQQQISREFRVRVNQQDVVPTIQSIEKSAKHHFNLVANLSIELPAGEQLELQMRDLNFRAQPGAIRTAFKASGAAMILQSNVAPILVRAERQLLDGLPALDRQKAAEINVKIGYKAPRRNPRPQLR